AADPAAFDPAAFDPAAIDPAAVEAELGAVVDGLYRFVEGNRAILQLFARCSDDLPELAQWYYLDTRRGLLDLLGRYLSARIEAGLLRPVPDVPVAARSEERRVGKEC